MTLRVERREFPETGTVVVCPVGVISIASLATLRRTLRGLVGRESRVVVIDLTRAEVEDSAVVLPLIEMARRMRAHGARLVIGAPPDGLADRLRIYGLGDRRARDRLDPAAGQRGDPGQPRENGVPSSEGRSADP